jgi:cytoskeletal protein RodZ
VRSLSIEEAAYVTRIRVHYLAALEEDDYSVLPSAAQGRGFLHSYASYLGVVIQPDDQPATVPAPEDTSSGSAEAIPQALPAPAEKETQRRSLFQRRAAKETPSPETDQAQPAVTAQVIFKQIGQMLRQQRELLGLSLGNIEQYTRLRLHYLKALESGDIDSLPSPVQGRGMLSNYAKFLNLDVDELLLKYADGLQLRRIERLGLDAPHRPEAQQVAYPALRRIVSFDLLIGIGLVVVLAVFLIWSISQVATAQNGANSFGTLPPVAEVLADTATPTGLPIGSTTAQAVTPSSQDTTAAAPLSQATPIFTVLPSSQAAIQLVVVSRQEAWLRVTVDGKVVFTGRVLPGNAYPFAGTKQIELLTGSAAALQVFYNQTDIGSLGLVGQVVDLIFTTQGLVQPTSTPVPSYTNTLPVTLTPRISGTPGTPQTTGTPTETPTTATDTPSSTP